MGRGGLGGVVIDGCIFDVLIRVGGFRGYGFG